MSRWDQILDGFQKPITYKAGVQNVVEGKRLGPVDFKVCRHCKQEKPRSEFYERRAHSMNALSSLCKACTSIYNAELYKKKKEQK